MPPALLVLRALGLGDLLAAVPALRGLRAAFPDHRLLLAAPAWLTPVARWTGAVDAVVDSAPLTPLARSLHRADVAVNLHGRGPQSTALLAKTAPGRLIAFAHPDVPASTGGPRWREDEHERARWCRLLRESGIAAHPSELRLDAPATPPPLLAGVTVIHPGAARPAVRWPAERFAAVAAAVTRPVITGTASEATLATEVAQRAGLPGAAVLAGRLNLDGLAAVVGGARCVISSDTGVAHLAVALGTPTVTVFGPVDPRRWGPPSHPRHAVLWAGRTGDPHALAPHPALSEIRVDDVLAAVRAVTATRDQGAGR